MNNRRDAMNRRYEDEHLDGQQGLSRSNRVLYRIPIRTQGGELCTYNKTSGLHRNQLTSLVFRSTANVI